MATATTVPAVPVPAAAAPASGGALVALGGGGQQNAAAFATLTAVAGRLKDYAATTFEQRKPWSEVLDRSSFAKPGSSSEAISRIKKNVAYFRINYLIVVLLGVAGSFLANPSSLFVLGFVLASWLYVFVIRTGPLVISGRELSEREKFLSMAALSFIVIFFLTNVGNLVFSALMMSGGLVALHGATRVPDDLFLDDADTNTGLLSIFTGGSSAPTGASAV